MTELQWPVLVNPNRMLGLILARGGKAAHADERFRLFGIACCRRVADALTANNVAALDNLELYATTAVRDPLLKARRLHREPPDVPDSVTYLNDELRWRAQAAAFARNAVWSCTQSKSSQAANAYRDAAMAAAYLRAVRGEHVQHRGPNGFEADPDEMMGQAALVRCVFGNPFRPVAFDPAWRTDTVIALARQMHDSRDFGAMPILADALQDAGCEDESVLMHCRQPGPHARGCWVCAAVLRLS